MRDALYHRLRAVAKPQEGADCAHRRYCHRRIVRVRRARRIGRVDKGFCGLELRVGSLDAAVTLDPTGTLLDPNCPQNTCKFSYVLGTKVKLAAVNGAVSSFVEWGGPRCSGSFPTCEVTVSGGHYVRASFSRLTLMYGAVTKGGYVRLDFAGGSCGSGCVIYPYGTTNVGLDAVVNDNDFEFDRWGGDCAGVDGPGCIFPSPMRVNRSVSAYFKRNDHLGTTSGPLVGTSQAYVRVTGRGTVSARIEGEDVKCSSNECRIDPLKGATVVLNTKPATGWRLYGLDRPLYRGGGNLHVLEPGSAVLPVGAGDVRAGLRLLRTEAEPARRLLVERGGAARFGRLNDQPVTALPSRVNKGMQHAFVGVLLGHEGLTVQLDGLVGA